ncbi:MAG: DNA-directed RNA polymerase subunit omega [Chitinophagales bacterium]|nr:DNA-directed RNA polymerase subunit omega [Chitinophagales bacterium]
MSTLEKKMEETKSVSPLIETRDLTALQQKSGNLYRSINVISKRSRQLNVELKEELHQKLEEFASTTDNLEEFHENKEQIEISKFYERLPKTTLQALNEFMNDELIYKEIEEEPEA